MPKRQRSSREEGERDSVLDDDDDRKPAAQPTPERPTPEPVGSSSSSSLERSGDRHNVPIAVDTTADSGNKTVNDRRRIEEHDRVTPHMERLLRLLSQGTSTESAALAAGQLAHLTGQSSALVLWQVLGQLQGLLCQKSMDSWKARENAAVAMQGVAAHLPRADQQAFFMTAATAKATFLRLSQVPVEAVLEQGQVLYAVAPSTYMEERAHDLEGRLQDLAPNDPTEFVTQRIRLQRRILAQRLGLAALEDQALLTSCDLQVAVSDSDLLATSPPVAASSRQRRRRRSPSEEEASSSIQHLLVREMSRASDHSGAASHKDPQHLLANEFIYRMFDNVWQRRHGALLGILALLKAWRKTVESSGDDEKDLFGPWPEDIMARSLCLLALDRFGDFSGSVLDDSIGAARKHARSESGGVVAPIREMAAQLFSVLWRMAPMSQQETALALLERFLEASMDWEVHHGVLLAMKYVTVIVCMETRTGRLSEVKKRWVTQCLDKFAAIAGRFLASSSHDVTGTAAQILCECCDLVVQEEWVYKTVWDVVQGVDVLSSCVIDMVTLLSSYLQSDPSTALCHFAVHQRIEKTRVVEQLVDILLRFSNSPFGSVRMAALKSLGRLAHDEVDGEFLLPGISMNVYSYVMKSMFDGYLRVVDEISILGDDEKDEPGRVLRQLDWTWSSFCKCAKRVNEESVGESSGGLLVELLDRYYNATESMSRPSRYHAVLLSPCEAVSEFIASLQATDKIKNILALSFRIHLASPWIHHCEFACGLLQRTAQLEDFKSTLLTLGSTVTAILEHMPICMQVIKCKGADVLDDQMKQQQRNATLRMLRELPHSFHSGHGENVIDTLRDRGLVLGSREYTGSDIHGMRLKATAASAVLFLGPLLKITPCVRALMTSMRNETSRSRLSHTAAALSHLLLATHDNDSQGRARVKILKTLSIIIISKAKTSVVEHCPAANTIGSYLGSLSCEVLPEVVSTLGFHQCLSGTSSSSSSQVESSLLLFSAVCSQVEKPEVTAFFADAYVKTLCTCSCLHEDRKTRSAARDCLLMLCRSSGGERLDSAFTFAADIIERDATQDEVLDACLLLKELGQLSPKVVGKFVRLLLPITLKAMTNPDRVIAQVANGMFATLVSIAPLVGDHDSAFGAIDDDHASAVVDHLIKGKPLPRPSLPDTVVATLRRSKVTLREYQLEGISWLSFLQSVNLNGALCDAMGLGKTLQALVGLALAHEKCSTNEKPVSIVVCPATIVNHWVAEVKRFFPDGEMFRPCAVVGSGSCREKLWENFHSSDYNLAITSYGTLRSDINQIENVKWIYCVLDEGHVLRNPKTATARASRRIPAKHRLVLSGTMIQNRVMDVWATFDFLMPNFLGSSNEFSSTYARPITKSQLPGAAAECINEGTEKLRLLHQQVLPFILRREKETVLKELPAKTIINLGCPMSDLQLRLYKAFASSLEAKESIDVFQRDTESGKDHLGAKVLRVLLFLRLICTHPCLINLGHHRDEQTRINQWQLSASGKFLALFNLLRDCGVHVDEFTAGDNDDTLIHSTEEVRVVATSMEEELEMDIRAGDAAPLSDPSLPARRWQRPKCLVFAQFTQTLDAIEEHLFKPYIPSLRYLRLDGSVPVGQRVDVANQFNRDETISVLLLTTRVGSLGLNLTGASIVIFMEHDFNPFVDEQAMDRVHRIGQKADSVSIYRLIAENSIDEKIMDMQRKKVAMSEAVVNTENSTLYSMGTDRLLDIFTPTDKTTEQDGQLQDLESILNGYSQDYASLSINAFIQNFQLGVSS